MLIRDDTNQEDSLYHLALRWARADTTNFLFDPDFVQYANIALDKLAALIKRHDASWKWKDANNSSELIDTSLNLASGTAKYAVPSAVFKIARVRIKDEQGNFRTIERKDRRDLTDDDLADTYIRFYYPLGGHLYLVGTPDYSYANGIEIQYQGTATHIDPDSYTDVSPGFTSELHELIALMPALDYLDINGPEDQAEKVRVRIGQEPQQGNEGSGLLRDLALSYLERDDNPQTITLETSTRAQALLE